MTEQLDLPVTFFSYHKAELLRNRIVCNFSFLCSRTFFVYLFIRFGHISYMQFTATH